MTTTTAAILARAHEAGVRLVLVDGVLRAQAAAPPPAELLAELRANKAELLALLGEPANDAEPAPDPGDLAAALAAAAAAGAAAAVDRTGDDPPDDDPPAPPMPDLPPPGTPERAALDARHATETAGYLAASRITPPSWWQPTPHHPTAGAVCSCCQGQRWWSRDLMGWCCATCHPETTEVRT